MIGDLNTNEEKISFCDFARRYTPGNAPLSKVFGEWRELQTPVRTGEIYVDRYSDLIVVVTGFGFDGIIWLLPVTPDSNPVKFSRLTEGFKSEFRKIYPVPGL